MAKIVNSLRVVFYLKLNSNKIFDVLKSLNTLSFVEDKKLETRHVSTKGIQIPFS